MPFLLNLVGLGQEHSGLDLARSSPPPSAEGCALKPHIQFTPVLFVTVYHFLWARGRKMTMLSHRPYSGLRTNNFPTFVLGFGLLFCFVLFSGKVTPFTAVKKLSPKLSSIQVFRLVRLFKLNFFSCLSFVRKTSNYTYIFHLCLKSYYFQRWFQ